MSNLYEGEVPTGLSDYNNKKTSEILKDLLGQQDYKKTRKSETGEKKFDLNLLDEKKQMKILKFNEEFDNTLVQMTDESEQIMMDNATFTEIYNDQKNIQRKFTPWTKSQTIRDEHRFMYMPFYVLSQSKKSFSLESKQEENSEY